jgi:uncharacterized protein (DUF1800 family)
MNTQAQGRLFICLTACLVLMTGCGGGDSGGGTPTTPPTTTPPTTPPVAKADAYRFLNQATFGASESQASQLIALGDSSSAYARWIDQQIALPASTQYSYVNAAYQVKAAIAGFNANQVQADRIDIWFQNAVKGPDQLRQRVAWALSQIMVVSQVSLPNYPLGLADYYDVLARDAFGNFRQLLQDVTLHPMMGEYLNMRGNRKPNDALNIRPDENYAREALQLFSIGLVQLNADGSVQKDAQGNPAPTYDQSVVEGFAHLWTGWNWACDASSPANCAFGNTRATVANQSLPMQAFADQHDLGSKKLLSYTGAVKPLISAGQTPAQDLADGLDNIFNHPNVAPFISRQLIQKLVTSNPSAAYVQRIASVFSNDGLGARGNLGAVVKAILLDPEARNAATGTAVGTAGKMKEPLVRMTQLWRAYGGAAANGKFLNFNPSTQFGQGPLLSGSVFNFFSPFYAPPGEIATQGLVAPELQISTEYQNAVLTNTIYTQAFSRNSKSNVTDANIIVINIDEEAALAADASALVARVADKLLAGQISSTLQTEVVAAVNRIAATNTTQRSAEAIWLIASSPEFAIQH